MASRTWRAAARNCLCQKFPCPRCPVAFPCRGFLNGLNSGSISCIVLPDTMDGDTVLDRSRQH